MVRSCKDLTLSIRPKTSCHIHLYVTLSKGNSVHDSILCFDWLVLVKNTCFNLLNINLFLYQQYLFVYRLVSAYVNKVVDSYAKCQRNGKNACKLKYPNFSAFVNHVINEYTESECYKHYNRPCFSSMNDHWRPFNNKCFYCDITYHVIGRIETFEEDVRYILLKKNLTNLIPLKASSTHKNKGSR